MKQVFIFMTLLVSIYGYSQTTPLFKTGNTVLKSIAVSPDGRTVAIEGESSEIALWDLGARKKVMTLKREETEKLDTDDPVMKMGTIAAIGAGVTGKLFFSPDGQRLILSHNMGLVVWNPKVEKPLIEFSALSDFFDVSDNGQYVAVIEKAKSNTGGYEPADIRGDRPRIDYVLLFVTQSGEMKKLSISSLSKVKRIRFVPGTTTILSLGLKGDLTLLDYLSGQTTSLKPMFNDNEEESAVSYEMDGMSSLMSPNATIAIHPNKKIVAATDSKEKLYLYDFKEEKLKQVIQLSNTIAMPGQGMERLQFTPNGKYLFGINKSLADQGIKKQIRFWEVETGKEVKSLIIDPIMFGLSFNAEGKYFAMGKFDETKKPPFVIGIFDANTLLESEPFQGRGIPAFFPNDPKRMAFLLSNGIGIHTIK